MVSMGNVPLKTSNQLTSDFLVEQRKMTWTLISSHC